MSLLELKELTVQRDTRVVVDSVSLTVQSGECIGLIGPNGAGKTSLMRAANGLLTHKGFSSLSALAPKTRAQACAWMPQSREIAWPVTVETLIALGRIPHLSRGSKLREGDQKAVDFALEQMDLLTFRHRIATELSGGEQARVLIARVLAQNTPMLMADEPIAGLDPSGQIATMSVFARLARQGHAVIVSIHDLGLAARHCSRLLLMDQGTLVADGTPTDVLTAENLSRVFGVSAHFAQTKDGPIFQPLEVL